MDVHPSGRSNDVLLSGTFRVQSTGTSPERVGLVDRGALGLLLVSTVFLVGLSGSCLTTF